MSTDGGDTWSSAFRWKGDNGSNAPAVVVQYSANGSTGWSGTPNDYIRFSTDGGSTFGSAYKIVGDDGLTTGIKSYKYRFSPVTNTTLTSSSIRWNVIAQINMGSQEFRAMTIRGSVRVYNDEGDHLEIALASDSASQNEGSDYSEDIFDFIHSVSKQDPGHNFTASTPLEYHMVTGVQVSSRYIKVLARCVQGGSGANLRCVGGYLEVFELD